MSNGLTCMHNGPFRFTSQCNTCRSFGCQHGSHAHILNVSRSSARSVLLTGALTMSFLGLAVRVKTRRPGVQYTESYDVSKMVMARSLQLNVTTVLSILKRIIIYRCHLSEFEKVSINLPARVRFMGRIQIKLLTFCRDFQN